MEFETYTEYKKRGGKTSKVNAGPKYHTYPPFAHATYNGEIDSGLSIHIDSDAVYSPVAPVKGKKRGTYKEQTRTKRGPYKRRK
jgi:hypothetical protein